MLKKYTCNCSTIYKAFITAFSVITAHLPANSAGNIDQTECRTFIITKSGHVEQIKLPVSLKPYRNDRDGEYVYASYKPYLDTGSRGVDENSSIDYVIRVSINPKINKLVKDQYSYYWMLLDLPWLFSGTSRIVHNETGSFLDKFCTPFERGFCPERVAGYQYYIFPINGYLSTAIEITQGIDDGWSISGGPHKSLIGSFSTSNYILAAKKKPIIIEILRLTTYKEGHPSHGLRIVYREYMLHSLNEMLYKCQREN